MHVFLLVVITLFDVVLAGNKIYMMRAEKMDQKADESGYVYTKDYEGPSRYETGPAITLGIQNTPPRLAESYQASYSVPFLIQAGLSDDQVNSGNSYNEDQFSKHGNQGVTSYNHEEGYHKGNKGSYGSQHDEGFNANKGNVVKSLGDAGNHYSSHHKKGGSYLGGSFGQNTYRKKGSETSGFHKVYHKDELKKKHTFYDEADHKGSFKKYDEAHKNHKSNSGSFEKGGNSDAGHQQNDFGKKGQYDKGHYDIADAAFQKKQGNDKYYSENSEGGNDKGQVVWASQKYQ